MIRRATQTPSDAPAWHAAFLEMLPAIQPQAKIAFRRLDPEGREEAVEEVTAYAVMAFKELWDRGKAELAYPSVLAQYGVKRVKIGRPAGPLPSGPLSPILNRARSMPADRPLGPPGSPRKAGGNRDGFLLPPVDTLQPAQSQGILAKVSTGPQRVAVLRPRFELPQR